MKEVMLCSATLITLTAVEALFEWESFTFLMAHLSQFQSQVVIFTGTEATSTFVSTDETTLFLQLEDIPV